MSKRVLNTLRHGAFIKRLKESAEIAGKIVIECSEYLTTQICDVCFEKNACESRTYECEHCHNVIDRDQHSAKLIFMRQITNIKQDESFAIQIELKWFTLRLNVNILLLGEGIYILSSVNFVEKRDFCTTLIEFNKTTLAANNIWWHTTVARILGINCTK